MHDNVRHLRLSVLLLFVVARFIQVARADAEFLARMKIMDYSLLTGIHDRGAAKPKVEEEQSQHQQQSPRRYSRL